MAKDYYKLLEIDRAATPEEIKQGYRILAQQYHPDKTAHLGIELREAANRKMMELNEAFDTLSHPERRQEYDLELMKAEEEELGAPLPQEPPPPSAAPGGGAKSDFWRDIERIEAERAAADRAAAEAAAQAPPEAEKPKAKPVSSTGATVSRNVVEDFIDKFTKAVVHSTGAKWTQDAEPGWNWVLVSGDWRRSYSIGYCHVDNLGTIGLSRVLSRAQTLIEKKKSALRQTHFLFLVAYDRIMDRQQVMDTCRSWAADSRKDGQRLLVLLDAAKLTSLLYGVPEEPRMHTVVKLLGTRG